MGNSTNGSGAAPDPAAGFIPSSPRGDGIYPSPAFSLFFSKCFDTPGIGSGDKITRQSQGYGSKEAFRLEKSLEIPKSKNSQRCRGHPWSISPDPCGLKSLWEFHHWAALSRKEFCRKAPLAFRRNYPTPNSQGSAPAALGSFSQREKGKNGNFPSLVPCHLHPKGVGCALGSTKSQEIHSKPKERQRKRPELCGATSRDSLNPGIVFAKGKEGKKKSGKVVAAATA